MRDILTGTPWETSGVFPRVSLCDFEVSCWWIYVIALRVYLCWRIIKSWKSWKMGTKFQSLYFCTCISRYGFQLHLVEKILQLSIQVRQVANIQRYSVQCVLVINIFNEKIFIFLWFWYMAMMVATMVSIGRGTDWANWNFLETLKSWNKIEESNRVWITVANAKKEQMELRNSE